MSWLRPQNPPPARPGLVPGDNPKAGPSCLQPVCETIRWAKRHVQSLGVEGGDKKKVTRGCLPPGWRTQTVVCRDELSPPKPGTSHSCSAAPGKQKSSSHPAAHPLRLRGNPPSSGHAGVAAGLGSECPELEGDSGGAISANRIHLQSKRYNLQQLPEHCDVQDVSSHLAHRRECCDRLVMSAPAAGMGSVATKQLRKSPVL